MILKDINFNPNPKFISSYNIIIVASNLESNFRFTA